MEQRMEEFARQAEERGMRWRRPAVNLRSAAEVRAASADRYSDRCLPAAPVVRGADNLLPVAQGAPSQAYPDSESEKEEKPDLRWASVD